MRSPFQITIVPPDRLGKRAFGSVYPCCSVGNQSYSCNRHTERYGLIGPYVVNRERCAPYCDSKGGGPDTLAIIRLEHFRLRDSVGRRRHQSDHVDCSNNANG